MEVERARLLKLAADSGFDEDVAKQCFDHYVNNVYGSDGMQFITVEECGDHFLGALAYAVKNGDDWDDLQAMETEACGALNDMIDQDCPGGSKWVEMRHVSPVRTASNDSDL